MQSHVSKRFTQLGHRFFLSTPFPPLMTFEFGRNGNRFEIRFPVKPVL